MSITSKKPELPRVSMTFNNELHIVDINTARKVKKEIEVQIEQHESEGVFSRMLHSVSSVFFGDNND